GEFTVIDIADGSLPTGTPGLEVDRGFVTDAHVPLTNLGFQETSGLDVSATKYFDLGERGELALLADAAYLFEFKRQASAGATIEDEAGQFTYPELTATARLRWTKGPWRASVRGRYVSSYEDDPSPRTLAAVGLDEDATVDVDSWLTFNASVSYDYGENSFVQLTIDNLFDEDPPLALGTSANVDHFNHNSLGRFITLRVGHAF
ncbi:MAG: TonB-dependent receptor, partial [Pseudomonadota bacterium]